MENPERFVELSGKEISTLRKSLFFGVFYTMASLIIGLVTCGLLYLYLGHLFCTVVLILIAAVLVLSNLVKIIAMVKNVFADTGARRKQVIVGKVEKLREHVTETAKGRVVTRALLGVRMTTSTSIDSNYFVKIENGKEYPVEMELYYALKEGDSVEIELAPNTGYVFGVKKLAAG